MLLGCWWYHSLPDQQHRKASGSFSNHCMLSWAAFGTRLKYPNPVPCQQISNCPLALHALLVRCVPGPQACFAFWSWDSTLFKERKEADKESEDSWSGAELRNCFSFLLLICCSASAHSWESWKLLGYIPVGYTCKKLQWHTHITVDIPKHHKLDPALHLKFTENSH